MNSDNLKIFSLGGLQEVGKNCYCFEKGEDLIIVDCGVKFLNDNNLVDGSVPNFSYLIEKKEKIKGLFITHGHEDHIGGIVFLLELIPTVPIFGSKFSISHLKKKLDKKRKYKLFTFNDNTIENTVEFTIKFFSVTHSIPGSFGIILEVKKDNSRIILTGDFKFD